MRQRKKRFGFETLEARLALAAEPIITEFMASNNSTLLDGNGVASDWIEIYNKGDQPVDLAGYSLTDDAQDLDNWSFPNKVLGAGEFLVVFASGSGVTDPAGNLHTDFALGAGGEYVALVSPGGAVLSEFGPAGADYPAQSTDVSYGLAFDQATTTAAAPNSAVKYLIPTNSSVDATWTGTAFNDSAWSSGTASIGYETSPDIFAPLIQTTVPAGTTSVYVRIPFNVESDLAVLNTLQMKYDDGFIAYLNGTRIAFANAPATGAFDSVATDTHDDPAAVQYVDFNVSSYSYLLQTGSNVLAIHLLNRSSGSSDLLLVPSLSTSTGSLIEPSVTGFLVSPTPRAANTQVDAGGVHFSQKGGAFSATFQLVLTADEPAATIRYTTNGTLPTATSPIYAGPITISTSVRVRARAYGASGEVGSSFSEAYTLMDATVVNFNSDLPIVVLENFSLGRPGDAYQDAWMSLYDVQAGTGRSALANEATFTSFIGQHDRGSSTGNAAKQNLRIELRNDAGEDQSASLLGMPAESDWILYAPYNFDRAMIRNTVFYELSRQMGQYATRTRFVEVYSNLTNGVLSSGDYMGVYVLMENIKRDSNRVDVAPLTPESTDITGGYILKIDRPDANSAANWNTTRGVPSEGGTQLVQVDPDVADLTIAQRNYIRNYVQSFEDALYGPNSRDPVLGYEAYFDVDASIDHHLVRALSKEPDSLRLSTYLTKAENGKLSFGPVWDFDRSSGADDDGRAANPTGWFLPDVDFFERDWWGPLFDDPDFLQRWVDRWQELRRGVLSDANLQAVVGSQAAEIAEAQVRNYQKWTAVAPNSGPYASPGQTGWNGEISHLSNWLVARARWMDGQMIAAAAISPPAGNVAPNTVVTLSSSAGNPIYYTLDGSDPRAVGGAISPSATLYTGPFAVAQSTLVTARAKGTPPSAIPFSSSSYTGTESPSMALDGLSTTKYRNNGMLNAGLIVTPVSGPSVLRSMILTTANDTPARDPASYVIYGTNSPIASANNSTGLAEPWTLIASGNLSLSNTRQADSAVIAIPNSSSYTSYKILFPNVKSSFNAGSMQIANIKLFQTTDGTGTQIQSASDAVRAVHEGRTMAGGSPWSEATLALYSVEQPASAANLRITELHYHPANPTPAELAIVPGTADRDFEFIELTNVSSQAISLNNVELFFGGTFNFNNGVITSLQPGKSVLVVSSIAAFQARYGAGLPVAGQYSGQLSNGGEQIVVEDSLNNKIHDFTFDDVSPWPLSADGGGPSLEVVDTAGNYSLGTNWRASAVTGGTPGFLPGLPGDFNDDNTIDGADFLTWQRGLGTGYDAADLAEWMSNFGASAALAQSSASFVAAAVIAPADEPAIAAGPTLFTSEGKSTVAPQLIQGPWYPFDTSNAPRDASPREARASYRAAVRDAVLANWDRNGLTGIGAPQSHDSRDLRLSSDEDKPSLASISPPVAGGRLERLSEPTLDTVSRGLT